VGHCSHQGLSHLRCYAAVEPRVPSHRLRRDEFPVPEDTETPDVSQPVLELSEDDHTSPDKDEEDDQVEEEEDEDDIPDAGAIEEEPSEGSDVSQAALSNPGSSSSSGEDPMVSQMPGRDSHLSIRLLRKRRLLSPQVAEEEAENLEAGPEEEEVEDESMDEAEGSLPSLGKRRSTDTALSGQTSAKRSRPGSLAEVSLPSLKHLTISASIPVSIHPSIHPFIYSFNVCHALGSGMHSPE